MTKAKSGSASFAAQAERILDLQIEWRINKLGGYGPEGEVIYEAHPPGCPSVLVDSHGGAAATFMSNGSTAFTVSTNGDIEVSVLEGSFDQVLKRETGVPSRNCVRLLRETFTPCLPST